MEITVKLYLKGEEPSEMSWWFTMYGELWVVTTSSHPPEMCGSKEDAFQYIIEDMTGINLCVEED